MVVTHDLEVAGFARRRIRVRDEFLRRAREAFRVAPTRYALTGCSGLTTLGVVIGVAAVVVLVAPAAARSRRSSSRSRGSAPTSSSWCLASSSRVGADGS